MRLFLLLFLPVAAGAQPRTVETVLPSLEYGPACSSTIELRNLGESRARVEVEAHRASGALAPLAGHEGVRVELAPMEHAVLRLEGEEGTAGSGWARVRERVASGATAVVAVSAASECTAGDQLRRVVREAAFPARNPWFDGDAAELEGGEIALVNTSEAAVTATGCYSSGSLYSLPGGRGGGEMEAVCSASFRVQVAPFGTRRFAVKRGESSHFALRTEGLGIVLEMLRPVEGGVRVFRVDSTIRFGAEVPVVK